MESLCITRNPNEAYAKFLELKGSFIEVRDINETNYYQVYNKFITESDETEAPIYNQILELEAIELHKLKTIIEKKGGLVLDLNTDCVACVFKNDILPFTILEDGINIKDYEYAEGIPKYKLEFKEERLKNAKLEKFKRSEKYEYKNQIYNMFDDVLDNNFDPLINTIIDTNQSFVINARAGCGKSTLIKMLQSKLTVLGKTHVSLAPTNKACRVINGKTIHKFVIESSKKSLKEMKIDYIIIDEISMVAEKFYKFFISVKRVRPDIKFIISGDFEQLLPV